MSNLLHSAVLPIRLTNGNAGRGYSWHRKADARKAIEATLRLGGHRRKPFSVPTRVTATRILGPRERLWDPSSLGRGNYKELEDALVALGWWHDDAPKWIRAVTFQQDGSRRHDGPAVQIEVYEA